MIYYAYCKGYVKIGVAHRERIWDRMSGLKTGNPFPIILVHVEEGLYRREKELHRQYAHLHHRGEWFRAEGELAWCVPEVEHKPWSTPTSRGEAPYVTKTGKVLTTEDIEALADEAERGYDVSHLKGKPNRRHLR